MLEVSFFTIIKSEEKVIQNIQIFTQFRKMVFGAFYNENERVMQTAMKISFEQTLIFVLRFLDLII